MKSLRIFSKNAPPAIGPYSQAVLWESLIFVSGQLGLDPVSGQLSGQQIELQTRRALENLKAILEEGGSGLECVLKTTVYLTDMANFQVVNSIYAEYFQVHPPARSTIGVRELPKDALIEVEAVAFVKFKNGKEG
ncbi:MAG: RidA family protein [Candidatus Eremiobacteraeota bacterium]|nr:RidA family protein [Candidatus Eremiobacteraeota bacterium]MCL5055209.1 RidA family protein [Bacillota bacterium]